MKFNGWLGLVLALVLTSSCRKDFDLFGSDLTVSSEDYTTQQDLLEANEVEISDQIESGLLTVNTRSFPTRTWSNPKGTYPNVLTIDYGPNGVSGPYGRVRKGKIIVQISAPLNTAGSIRVVNHDHFFIDDVKVEGTVTLTNQGINSLGQSVFLRNVFDRLLTFPSGKTISWNATQNIIQLEGNNTPLLKTDDVWSIAGNSNGINRQGKSFNVTVSEPLITMYSCRYVVEGVINLFVDSRTFSIDFGDGACNNVATLILADGSTKEITIRRWW